MIKPFGDRLLVSQMKKEQKSQIILSEDLQIMLPKGIVEEIGIGAEDKGIKKGDIIFFNDFSGERINNGDNEYLLVRLNEVLAIDE